MSLKGEKILVCITIQKNSKRLIEKGSEIAMQTDGELHILHVEKGMNIFEQEDSIELLEALFEYGKQLGGEVHFTSDENVPNKIVEFIKDVGITRLVLGQTMKSKLRKLLKKDINSYVISETKDVETLVLDRKIIEKKLVSDKKSEFAT